VHFQLHSIAYNGIITRMHSISSSHIDIRYHTIVFNTIIYHYIPLYTILCYYMPHNITCPFNHIIFTIITLHYKYYHYASILSTHNTNININLHYYQVLLQIITLLNAISPHYKCQLLNSRNL
jgi:hypothetical protein